MALSSSKRYCGESADELGFADAGGAEEDEAADGALRIAEAGAIAEDGVGDEAHGFVLADDAIFEAIGHLDELLDFAFEHAGDGNAGPLGDDGGDIVLVDLLFEEGVGFDGFHLLLGGLNILLDLGEAAVAELGGLFPIAGAAGLFLFLAEGVLLLFEGADAIDGALFAAPALLEGGGFAAQGFEVVFDMAEAFVGTGVLLLAQGLALDLEVRDAAFEDVDFDGHGADLEAQGGAGLVDQVDGLVGEEAIGDVALGEDGGGDDGGVFDAHAVVDFEFLLEAAENGDGVVDGGLADHDGLEAAGEGGVFFDVLLVFVERGGADAAQFAAGQGGLEQIGGVDGAFGGAGADEGVELVDEAEDFAVGIDDFLDDGLEAVFEFAAELGAGDHAAEIDGDQFLVLELIGHVAADDALGEAFDDGGFADAGFADEDGIVLGAAAEHLHDAADFVVAADDGIEFAEAGGFGEVVGVALESLVFGLGILIGDALRAADGDEGLEDGVVAGAGLFEKLAGGIAAFLGDGEQEVLGGDEFVFEANGFVEGALHDLVERRGEVHAGLHAVGFGQR